MPLEESMSCCKLRYRMSKLKTPNTGTNEVHGSRAPFVCRQSPSSLLSKLSTSIRANTAETLAFDNNLSPLYPSSATRSWGMNDAMPVNSSHEVKVPFSWSSESRRKGDARSWDGGG